MSWDNGAGASFGGWGSYGGVRRERKRWTRYDVAAVLLLTVLSAIASFVDLGDRTAPQTYWKPDRVGEGFVVDFGEPWQMDRITLYEGPGARGETLIESSLDGETWTEYLKVEHKTNRVFTWKHEDKPVEARYMRFTAERTGYRLYEAAFYNKLVTDAPIPYLTITANDKAGDASEGGGEQVFDEPQYAVYRPDYRNSMYFDEIYHGRTAYEFIHGMEPYENTHPPLGKIVLELGIRLFDMTPYGWRFAAAVFGTLMVPIFYAVARGMFNRTRYAVIATTLLALEGFRLVHSRMANVDIIGVTFTIVMFYAMYRYGEAAWNGRSFRRGFGWLALSGLFFGLAASVKWNYLYGGAGLAILLGFALYRRWRESRSEGLDGYWKKTVLTLLACVLFFVAVPAAVYTASYDPFIKGTQADDSYKDMWEFQKRMYNYHKGVKEEHPYSSKWYTWPLMLRPVWYYGGKDLQPGDAQSIAALGNPVIWWAGLLAMLAAWGLTIAGRFSARLRDTLPRDRIVLTLAVTYLSFYVPWMVAPRSITFLYHYFPMVPVIILSLVWMFRWFEENVRNGRWVTRITMAAAVFAFVWLYPVYVGITVDRWWMNQWMRWLSSWGF